MHNGPLIVSLNEKTDGKLLAQLREAERAAHAMRIQLKLVPVELTTEDHLSDPNYNPAALLNALHELLMVQNDAKLAVALRLPHAAISKLRNRRTSLTAGTLLRMHDVTKLPADDLRRMAGLKGAQ